MLVCLFWLGAVLVSAGLAAGFASMTGLLRIPGMSECRVRGAGAALVEWSGLAGLIAFLLGLNLAISGLV